MVENHKVAIINISEINFPSSTANLQEAPGNIPRGAFLDIYDIRFTYLQMFKNIHK